MKILFLCLGLTLGLSTHSFSQSNSTTRIPMTLLNKSAKSIPLIIPTYMNPNLSPFSSSGVDLKIGQKVYFKFKGKKRVLLVVTEEMANQSLAVDKLLAEKIKELKKGS